MALAKILSSSCFKRSLSPRTLSRSSGALVRVKWCFFTKSCGLIKSSNSCSIALIEKSSSRRLSLPLSILAISSTSLIRFKRWLLAVVILARQSWIRSLSSRYLPAMAVIPIMAFIGVRISWLIRERNSFLAILAALAASKASCKACCSRSSFNLSSWISRRVRIIWW